MIHLKSLPYAYDALEPVISAKTISFHYEKHHKGYVDKLVGFIGEAYAKKAHVLTLVKESREILSQNEINTDIRAKYQGIYNNAAQHYNHEFYWESLTPNNNTTHYSQIIATIPSNLMKLIGSHAELEELLEKFHKVGVSLFGSGWVWLTVTDKHELLIESTQNADLPKHKPLLVLDVWEHAYYLDYQNDRSRHLRELLKYLNWEKAAERLQHLI